MVIGIIGDQEKEKLRKFFSDNYSFKFVDVDEILSDILKNRSELLEETFIKKTKIGLYYKISFMKNLLQMMELLNGY